MRLDEIVISGFKSFPERTVVKFPSNLNAVVGPNGCGKSNILDAARFVMGESSAKYMRGGMAEVIFSGSRDRSPLAQASVELIFDNQDGRIGGQYAQYSKISVKRVVARDEQSNYYLNGTRCRRKDVVDIFLGTGVGSRSYAIIMQDTISRIIEAKPEELRVYIEEAAGISKYKERRHETELRIAHTKDNLERLNDIREELDKQLRHLQRQAKAAEKYKSLKAQEKTLQLQIAALEWQEFGAKIVLSNKDIDIKENEKSALHAGLAEIDTQNENARQAHIGANDELNRYQEQLYEVRSEIAKTEQKKQYQQERQTNLKRDQAAIMKQIADLEQQHTEAHSKQQGLSETLSFAQPELETLQTKSQTLRSSLDEAEVKAEDFQERWDEFHSQLNKAAQSYQVEKTRLEHLTAQQAQLKQTLQEISQHKKAITYVEIDQNLETLRHELTQHQHNKDIQAEALKTKNADIQTIKATLTQSNEALRQKQRDLHQLQQRLAALKGLQQAALGQTDHTLMQWLKENGLDKESRLGQVLEVEPGFECAIETVLSNELEAVCINQISDIQRLISHAPSSNFTLYFSERNADFSLLAENISLAHKVKTSISSVTEFLSTVSVAENLEEALNQQRNLAENASIITKDGTWIGRGWVKISKKQQDKDGIIKREQAIKKLQEEVKGYENEISQLEQSIQGAHQQITELEEEQKQVQKALMQLQGQINHHETEIKLHNQKRESLAAKNQDLEQRLNHLQNQIQTNENLITQTENAAQQAQTTLNLLQQKRETFASERDEYQDQVDNLREQFNECRDEMHQLQLQNSQLTHQIQALQHTSQANEHQLGRLRQKLNEIEASLTELGNPIVELDDILQKLLENKLLRESEVTRAKEALAQIDQTQKALHEKRNRTEKKFNEVRNQLEKFRIEAEQYRIKINNLEEIFNDKNHISEVIASLNESFDISALQSELEHTVVQIERLGAINLAAIEEFQTLSERKSYLDNQHADLEEALNILQEAIHKIDKETRGRFKETFEKVNENFSHLFPKIFGGGEATMILTDDDLLKTGVTLMARPPGKRNTTIHLLSGGEKALTAIALVFSLFKLNPAPFCMLDEVDAPLDDANIGRFCNLMKELSQDIQFIFISHNKLAIEMAKHLTGVAMREPGVSRLVAVDIDAAIEMAGE